jgi:hypothetical protein
MLSLRSAGGSEWGKMQDNEASIKRKRPESIDSIDAWNQRR